MHSEGLGFRLTPLSIFFPEVVRWVCLARFPCDVFSHVVCLPVSEAAPFLSSDGHKDAKVGCFVEGGSGSCMFVC